MTHPLSSKRRQSGQAAVLIAILMAGLLIFVGLVFMAGSSYVQRRNMQQVSDGFALSFGSQISGSTCGSSPALTTANVQAYGDLADSVLANNISPATSSSITGDCISGWTLIYNHPNSLTITATYPYNYDYQNVLVFASVISPLQFSGFLGTATATLSARAVARHSGGGIGTGFAIMSNSTVSCQGSAHFNVLGSVYARTASTSSGCGLYAHAIKDSNGIYSDYGNFDIYQDGSPWGASSTFSNCTAQLCADGYELAGHLTPSCGVTASTMYLDSTDLTRNPNPCLFSYIPPVPLLGYPYYAEPNISYPNPTGGLCSAITSYGSGAVPTLDAFTGLLHFHPGCYSTLDVSNFATGIPVLDPGFYYFNGVGNNKGGGLCLGGKARLLGSDVTLEFVNATSFSVSECNTVPVSACGASANCGFGADPASPVQGYTALSPPLQNASAWCNSNCPLAGELIWSSSTGNFFIKGGGAFSWLEGTVFWPATCTWWANGDSTLQGQLVCNNSTLQGGSGATTTAITYNDLLTARGRGETTLIE